MMTASRIIGSMLWLRWISTRDAKVSYCFIELLTVGWAKNLWNKMIRHKELFDFLVTLVFCYQFGAWLQSTSTTGKREGIQAEESDAVKCSGRCRSRHVSYITGREWKGCSFACISVSHHVERRLVAMATPRLPFRYCPCPSLGTESNNGGRLSL